MSSEMGYIDDQLEKPGESLADLDRIDSIEKMTGYVRSASTIRKQPQVIDGASKLLVTLYGEAGRHARTATGVAQLPFGSAVQLEMIVRLADK